MPDMQISLASLVRVRTGGLRSINVERDVQQQSLIGNYVFTAQARRALMRILDSLNGSAPSRAWTLTGPYGSGKSYFGLFVLNLLSATLPAHASVVGRLHQVDPFLTGSVQAILEGKGALGLLPVPITGHRASFQHILLHGLGQALQPLRSYENIGELLSEVDGLGLASHSSRAVVDWIERVLAAISQPVLGYKGLLLLLDEMGKPLEYAASHPAATDIYLLQELAELANRSGRTPLVFIGILHQAFERYAGNLDGAAQREWAKVQGRFEDIAFQESPDQQMRLLASALEHADGHLMRSILAHTAACAHDAIAGGWLPPLMSPEEFTNLSVRAYPLHPTAFVALPYLFRRLAQNERSLFAYLASQEPFGFQELLQTRTAYETIRLPDLFDYLVANFQGRLYASLRARPLIEALERLENGHDLSPLATKLIKSIGLLNWLGEVSPLQATEDRLLAAVRSSQDTDDQIRETLRSLQAHSYVVYRRFNRTYNIWQGSDVDVEQRLEDARQRLTGAFSLAEAIQRYLSPRPIVARRHSYQSGVIRYFEVHYVDQQTVGHMSLQPNKGASGLVLICLPRSYADAEALAQWAVGPALKHRPDVVVGVMEHTTRLVDLIGELRSLQWVRENTLELRDDPVARRELRARLVAVENLIRRELDRSLILGRLSDLRRNRWFRRGAEIPVVPSLSHYLSSVCDELYPETPRLWNELINRRILSSQGAAARRNLIEAMLTRGDRPTLGIQGYPPERSMYESLLKASGLHRPTAGGAWAFGPPPKDDPLYLRPVWQAISDFVFSMPPEPHSVQDLFEHLSAPPYGLTAGVMPVLLCAFLLAHQDETTLYREGTLLPEPGVADWEVLLRRPGLFAIAGCRVTGLRAAVVERIARGLRVPPYVMPVVRAVIGRLKALPEHVWRTRRLPETALALRRVVETARSPERFLFVEMPEALGLPAFEEGEFDQERLDLFFQRLNLALDALANATPRLLVWARDTWLTACGLPIGEEGWELFRQEATRLVPRVVHPTLAPLLKRAVETPDSRSALESVLAFLANRPVRTWTDADRERFEAQAQHLGPLFRSECADDNPLLFLSPAQQARSRQLVEDMRAYLTELHEDPGVLRAALQELLNGLK